MAGRYGFIIWADSPPDRYTWDDQLLVSLTIADVVEAYNEGLREESEGEPLWEGLTYTLRGDFIDAVSAYSVPLEDIWAGILWRIGD